MNRNIFGWSLPPSCGKLPGEEPDMLDGFESQVDLNPEEIELLQDTVVCQLLEKMFNWANKLGWNEAVEAEAYSKMREVKR